MDELSSNLTDSFSAESFPSQAPSMIDSLKLVVIVLLLLRTDFSWHQNLPSFLFAVHGSRRAAAAGSKNARSALRLIDHPTVFHLCGAVWITSPH